MDVNPLPLATQILPPTTCTAVGYQPTGIKPLDLADPGSCTSNTARQLLSAFATYSVLSSPLSARAFVVEPGGASGYKAALSVSTTFRLRISMTDTLLSFALATKSQRLFRVIQMSFGLSPTAISPANARFPVSNIRSLSQPQQVM